MYPAPTPLDRILERAAARGQPDAVVRMKITHLRLAVRAAAVAELPAGAYAPAKRAGFAELHSDLVMDSLLEWAAALYQLPRPVPIKRGRGRPGKDEKRGPAAQRKTRGHPRATMTYMAGQAFIEQWVKYFPDYGRGRGANGRAALRDAAASAFLSVLQILHSNPRNLIKRIPEAPAIRSELENDELPSN